VAVEFAGWCAVGGPDQVVASAIVTCAGLSATGERLRELLNRLSRGLARGADGWRVVHEHTSAPIDFERGLAMLRKG